MAQVYEVLGRAVAGHRARCHRCWCVGCVCGGGEMNEKTEGYHCVVCGRFLPADEYGVIVHDDIPHPPEMDFAEEEKPQ